MAGGMGEVGAKAGAPMSAREYSRQVQEWLWQCYCGSIGWPAHSGAPFGAHLNPFYSLQPPMLTLPPPTLAWQRPPQVTPPAAAAPEPVRPTSTAAGREYMIPSLMQRFLAELVDFFILFFIKAAVILTIMHFSGIRYDSTTSLAGLDFNLLHGLERMHTPRDISKFAMHYIIEEIDEDTSMEDLQKMMIVALIYRLLVCFYEIICLWGAGGATPGKFLLGLRVVTCDTSVLTAPNRVLVIPSSNVGLTASTIRALIKNFSIAFFFPAFITLLFFQHNRTAYDIVAGTIVVKRNRPR